MFRLPCDRDFFITIDCFRLNVLLEALLLAALLQFSLLSLAAVDLRLLLLTHCLLP